MDAYVLPDRDDPRLAPFAARGLNPPPCDIQRAHALTLYFARDMRIAAVFPDMRPLSIKTLSAVAKLMSRWAWLLAPEPPDGTRAPPRMVGPDDVVGDGSRRHATMRPVVYDDAELTTVCRIDSVDGGREWHKLIMAPVAHEDGDDPLLEVYEICHMIPKGHTWGEFTDHMRRRSN